MLIRVYAATVNRTDCAILSGKPFIMRLVTGLFKPALSSTGTDFSGVVEAVGKEVTAFEAGNQVWGFDDSGLASHAQYITIPANKAISTLPANFTHEEAAASAEGAHYAYNFINKVRLRAGQNMLVNGASGAIGSSALQFLKYFGARVTAVCDTKNIGLIQSLGADKVIDYTKEDFTKTDEKFDFVFDTVGKSTFSRCKPLLRPGGVYISSELGPNSQNLFLALITPMLGGKKVIVPIPSNIKKSLSFVKELIGQEKFKPVIDRKYPLAEIKKAFEYVASGQKTGNVVIRME